MTYFKVTQDSKDYEQEWKDVVQQIQNWPQECRDRLLQPSHHIEAKALYVFTIARRHVCAAAQLAQANGGNWKLIFVEASSLLFPMIELVGEARKAPSGSPLGAGIQWLRDPNYLPPQNMKPPKTDQDRLNNLLTFMPERLQGPTVSDLFYLRNYYLHGVKNNSRNKAIPIADIINADLPEAIARYSEEAMREYWRQLRGDDGTHHWVERLAAADIHPLRIQGSNFEAGLIDPDIVAYLEDSSHTVFTDTPCRN